MKNGMKKGSLVLEIGVGIAILAFIMYRTLLVNNEKDFLNEIDNTISNLNSLIMVGIYDSFKGYTTSSGGNCSSAFDVIDISAKRIKNCTNMTFNLVDETTGDDTVSMKSYFTFLDKYSKNSAYGCKVFVSDKDDTTTQLLINCSGLDSKYYSLVEQKIPKQLSKQLPLMFKTSYSKALDFTNLNLGNEEDGIFIIEFQK